MTEAKPAHGFFFWVGVIVASAIVLFVGSAIVAGIIEGSQRHNSKSSYFPPGVVGVQNIDSGTDYVFKDEPTTIGGACTGWKKVSVGARGHSADDITNVICWREVDGMLHIASEREESTTVQPMSNVTTPQ
jgi:hypothetical protein